MVLKMKEFTHSKSLPTKLNKLNIWPVNWNWSHDICPNRDRSCENYADMEVHGGCRLIDVLEKNTPEYIEKHPNSSLFDLVKIIIKNDQRKRVVKINEKWSKSWCGTEEPPRSATEYEERFPGWSVDRILSEMLQDWMITNDSEYEEDEDDGPYPW